ncbi:UDP-GlcNAc:betaGal beta-1,3-N-acetylglucosaminyltransferase-like protein 1 isoform X2 [Aplysia californica]|uniref:UDP-GlcNAc:betaGal beta-1,3-N-acetylglucosaminyltransferase-like protein 1 isoform X2 n=1 Tax=Aplysia californica TaxID=6500 RepID=A0ABM0ZY30_APLCA|nr:UDP-GlcNAc:betaGal beta-1,3-N-acetylglucosaminyltransferase-like protein 1 isoform X2 [Aplysia californica]
MHVNTFITREKKQKSLTMMENEKLPLVSITVPVHNASAWISECLKSVLHQTYLGPMELCIYNDASSDDSMEILNEMKDLFDSRGIKVKVTGHSGEPKGVGFAKNQAIAMGSGDYLCFLDADDVMHPDRVSCQLQAAQLDPRAIVGCKFHRKPEGSTERFSQWANRLCPHQLYTQAYTSHGPTVIMPTWFCHRNVVESVGGFHEGGKGVPEDLIFFYAHLCGGGTLTRVDKDLLMYRYHPECATFSVKEETIWDKRVAFLEQEVLKKWDHFSIWNAGKQGRKLFRSLSRTSQSKVTMFCDVDERKISKKYYIYENSPEVPKPKVPIVYFTEVKPPIIICIKMDLSGNFEQNLSSLRLKEGRDFIHFN